jgi:type IV pilus assembly protein PilV
MSMMGKQNPSKAASGFTLVELMVAIMVLAIGLLGLASLQATGLGSNHNAYLRTQATLLAQDMAERMRNNRANLAAYPGAVASGDDCVLSPCTSAQMVGYDTQQWNDAITKLPKDGGVGLPGGVGTIIGPVAGVYTIRIQWNEHVESQDPNKPTIVQRQFDMSFQP